MFWLYPGNEVISTWTLSVNQLGIEVDDDRVDVAVDDNEDDDDNGLLLLFKCLDDDKAEADDEDDDDDAMVGEFKVEGSKWLERWSRLSISTTKLDLVIWWLCWPLTILLDSKLYSINSLCKFERPCWTIQTKREREMKDYQCDWKQIITNIITSLRISWNWLNVLLIFAINCNLMRNHWLD